MHWWGLSKGHVKFLTHSQVLEPCSSFANIYSALNVPGREFNPMCLEGNLIPLGEFHPRIFGSRMSHSDKGCLIQKNTFKQPHDMHLTLNRGEKGTIDLVESAELEKLVLIKKEKKIVQKISKQICVYSIYLL